MNETCGAQGTGAPVEEIPYYYSNYSAAGQPSAAVSDEGERKAQTSMILGIIAAALALLGSGTIFSIVLGIIGLVMASKAKQLGVTNSERTAGFVCSLGGLIVGVLEILLLIGAIFLVAAVGIGIESVNPDFWGELFGYWNTAFIA